jgi:hypothetical protein
MQREPIVAFTWTNNSCIMLTATLDSTIQRETHCFVSIVRLRLKCDGTRAETRFRLPAKRTSPFKSAGGGRQFSRLPAAEVCASAVVMLEAACSEVVWRILATHSIRQFPLHFPSRASPCAITFQLDSTPTCHNITLYWHCTSFASLLHE